MNPEMDINEFSITELEDRLEFAELCNNNCSCGTQTPQKPAVEAPADNQLA
jgi:hypothetical protein